MKVYNLTAMAFISNVFFSFLLFLQSMRKLEKT